MYKSFVNYIGDVRRWWADNKRTWGGFNFSRMLDDAQKERSRLRKYPPHCSSVIRYVPARVYEEIHGEFIFMAADVEQQLKDTLRKYPHLANGDEGAILNWLLRRDESLTEPTDVPSIWARFQYPANDLVRVGKAAIYCRECETAIEPDQIVFNDDRGKRGWNFDRVVCPHGHNLLVVEVVHLMMG